MMGKLVDMDLDGSNQPAVFEINVELEYKLRTP